MAVYFPEAEKKDAAAAKVYIKLAAEHSKLAGLYPDDRQSRVTINNAVVGGGYDEATRRVESKGIAVVFRKPDPSAWIDDPPPSWPANAPLLEHEPAPWTPKPKPEPEPEPPRQPTKVIPPEPSTAPFTSAFDPGKKHWMS
jgi:hypothetical protein